MAYRFNTENHLVAYITVKISQLASACSITSVVILIRVDKWRLLMFIFSLWLLGEIEEEMENPEIVDLPEKEKHQLRHRELFLSRQLESLPATHIR